VTEVTADGIKTHKDREILSSLVVWAAGIKGTRFPTKYRGARDEHYINQLKVKSTLQTTLDENIFAFGDCASCPICTGCN
jgi:NADH dehydrogenase